VTTDEQQNLKGELQMIKSKLIMLVASTGLTVALGAGGFLMSSKADAINNDGVKIQSSSETSSENKETKNEEAKKPSETTNNTVASGEKVSTGSNNEANNESSNNKQETNGQADKVATDNNSSEDCYTGGQYTPIQKPADTPSQGGGSGQGSSEDPTAPDSSNYIAEIEQAIFQRVNQERAAAGLPALSYNGTMEYYARVKSKDMGDRGYFDHKDPEGRLITDQMKADGVSYSAWGENIAYIQGSKDNAALATQFMDNWMNSPGHRANILSPNFSSIGIGVYKVGNTYYATQEFYR
jgi:uncharacterized protein YkwD